MGPNGTLVKKKIIDAGIRKLDHYQTQLPEWRFILRNRLIPIVRWETPILADLQGRLRTPALDSYFAFTANLGTHTFFMIFLPILFWSGEVQLARAMVNLLASGVFFSGCVKDMLCLPRPLSPPLQRITRSASAALEYGFPSTHSTNAVSVAVYALYSLNTSTRALDSQYNLLLQLSTYVYVASIVLGRLYCGMHGFFDVVIGSSLGAALALLQCMFGDPFDIWIMQGNLLNTLIFMSIVLILVRIHPEPADDCPCFDDSVAFAGVIMGVQIGNWHFARSGYASNVPILGAVPFALEEVGLVRASLRLVIGVLVIFIWRAVAKPTLLTILPPIFRVVERLGLTNPRVFFLRASQYSSVPHLRKDDNVIPSASDIPAMLSSLSHPRKRTVSVGPQSQADVYEAIAVRDQKRRDSEGEQRSPQPAIRRHIVDQEDDTRSSAAFNNADRKDNVVPRQVASIKDNDHSAIAEDENDDDEMFRKIGIPRVRYDVEVVTKLIVYAGIAWIATEFNPVLFEHIGLAMGVRPR